MAENRDNICSICLENMIFPTVLNCGHIFCFLCVKGIAFKSRKCALCRAEIPLDFFENPKVLNASEESNNELEKSSNQEYQWYYQGRNGWWQFEKRTNNEIEEAWLNGKKNCIVLIAGYCYIIDFENMVQCRQNEPSRHRKIKRDLATAPKKGIAGIRLSNSTPDNKTDAGHSKDTDSPIAQSTANTSNSQENDVIEIADNDDNEPASIDLTVDQDSTEDLSASFTTGLTITIDDD